MVILTALLVIGAFLAYRQLNRQIKQSQDHHNEQLRSSLRPLMVVQDVAVRLIPRLTPNSYEIHVAVQNVGAGPALEIEIWAWARVVDAWNSEGERRIRIQQLRDVIDIDHPEFTLRMGGVAAADPPRPLPLTSNGGPVEIEGDFIARGILLYIVLYKDVFGHSFPSSPRSTWRGGLGHQTVSATLAG